jgi:hypothetical protein
MPLRAAKAIGKDFNVGDYFLFRGSVGFVASAEIMVLLAPTWGLGLSAGYLLEEAYQLQIVRLNQKKSRLKVVGRRANTLSAGPSFGFLGQFEVFPGNPLSDLIEREVNLRPIRVNASYARSDIFIADYVLDLSNPAVAGAFERVLLKLRNLKSIRQLRPFERDVDENFLLDLTSLEDLYRRDIQNDTVARIRRNLRASSDQDIYGIGLDVGNKIVGFKANGAISEAEMTISQPDESLEWYLLKMWSRNADGPVFTPGPGRGRRSL